MGNEFEPFGRMAETLRVLPAKPLSTDGRLRISRALAAARDGKAGKKINRRFGRIALAGSAAAVLIAALVLVLLERNVWDTGRRSALPIEAVSPKFDLIDEEGRVIYPSRLRGIEGKIGYTEYEGGFIANSGESVAKVFWFVWGDRKELRDAKLVAKGKNLNTGETVVVNESRLNNPLYGADASTVTAFNLFPSKGIWRIDVELDGVPFASIVTRVKDEYIRTASSYFQFSKDDAFAGEHEVSLVVQGNGLAETVDVFASPADSRNRQTVKTTFAKAGEYLQAMEPITTYTGKLSFGEPGKWRIEVLGEKTDVDVLPLP